MFIKSIGFLGLLGLGACGTPEATQSLACLVVVAPTVVAEAGGTGSNATKGINSGVAVLNTPACIAAAATLVTKAPAAPPAAPAVSPGT